MIGFQFWDIKVKLIHNINFIGLQKPYWSVTKNWKYHKTAFSLNKVFPGSATRYCYFHYTQSLKRQLSEKGVQAREETNLAIGQFRYLYTAARLSAYVPPQDVRQWFEQVKKYTWNKGSPPEKKMFSFGYCPKRGGGETPARICWPFFPPCCPLYFDINIMLCDTFWSFLTPKSSKVQGVSEKTLFKDF